ncbi:glycosyltransferase family 39 protein [Patescibacteria group bacterium]|nr:glycosyltransferase family 39 protein [Patescibacteria group bacterium]
MLIASISHTIKVISVPAIIKYAEGLSWFQGEALFSGNKLYSSVNDYPWIYTTYPPVGPLIFGAAMKIFGGSLITLRTTVLLFEILIAVFVFLYLKYKTKDNILGISIGIFTFLIFATHEFHSLARIDFIYLFFNLATFYFFTRFFKKQDLKNMILTIIFFNITFLTKQPGIFLLIPFLTTIFYKKKNFIVFNIATIVTTLIVYIILNLATSFGLFQHTIIYQFASGKCSIPSRIKIEAIKFLVIFILGAVSTLYLGFKKNMPIKVFFISNLLWAVLSVRKCGADSNYLLEPMLYGLLITGLAINKLKKQKNIKTIYAIILLTLILTLTIVFVPGNKLTKDDIIFRFNATKAVKQAVDNNRETIISEEPYYGFVNNKDVILLDPFQYSKLFGKRYADSVKFINYLKNNNLTYIIAGNRLKKYIPGISALLEERYKPITPMIKNEDLSVVVYKLIDAE